MRKTNSAFCSVTTYNPAVASFTEQLYDQMASNSSFTKRNIQNANAYLLNTVFLSGAKLFGHVSHSTELVTHTCPIYTNGYDLSNHWSIGTNGTIGMHH